MPLSQATRQFEAYGPFENDRLVFRRMHLVEELGRPSRGWLELLCEEHDFPPESLLGQPFTVNMKRPELPARRFHGHATSVRYAGSVGGFALYRVEFSSWLSLLDRFVDCRIFQFMNVPEIVGEVLRNRGVGVFSKTIIDEYPIRDYCVQYDESDLAFVLRLLEEEGIFFSTEHEGETELIVLRDASTMAELCRSDPIRYYEKSEHMPPGEFILGWDEGHSLETAYITTDAYDFKIPNKPLYARSAVTRSSDALSDSEFYVPDRPYTEHSEGEHYSRVDAETLAAAQRVARGETNCVDFAAGKTFVMTDHPRANQNHEYLVTKATYSMRSDDYIASSTVGEDDTSLFRCQFEAIPRETLFRPERRTPRPRVRGVQTAIVTGPEGREIFFDKHGRVKVHFRWDRHGEVDDTSSCWIRVAQNWAGKWYGSQFLPRIGDEVIVDFIDGNPDRPIITGCVYNGTRPLPYELPANSTMSGIRTRSSADGSSRTANEIRFEDKMGSEELFFRAEKDHIVIVQNDEARKIGNDKVTDVEHDQKSRVGNDRVTQVEGEDSLYVTSDRRVICDGSITIVSETEIKLQAGDAAIYMKSDGTIVLDGVNIVVNAEGGFAYTASSVVGEASEVHHFKGATVNHNTG